jgi:hypothetical protein
MKRAPRSSSAAHVEAAVFVNGAAEAAAELLGETWIEGGLFHIRGW